MAPDPVPKHAILLSDRERPVAESDANGINVILTFQFLELQAGMGRIALEKPIGAFGVLLNIEWQGGDKRQNCRVVRDCIKEDRLVAASCPPRLHGGLPGPSGG